MEKLQGSISGTVPPEVGSQSRGESQRECGMMDLAEIDLASRDRSKCFHPQKTVPDPIRRPICQILIGERITSERDSGAHNAPDRCIANRQKKQNNANPSEN